MPCSGCGSLHAVLLVFHQKFFFHRRLCSPAPERVRRWKADKNCFIPLPPSQREPPPKHNGDRRVQKWTMSRTQTCSSGNSHGGRLNFLDVAGERQMASVNSERCRTQCCSSGCLATLTAGNLLDLEGGKWAQRSIRTSGSVLAFDAQGGVREDCSSDTTFSRVGGGPLICLALWCG